jgi:hypothetical protein
VKPTIRILHNLARSGGTIISRCLACMDGIALLSEIHPDHRDVFDPVEQAALWYNIEVPGQLGFASHIAAIEAACRERGNALVLRTWDHVDFMPNQWTTGPLPMRSKLVEALSGSCDLIRAAIVREPEPTRASLAKYLAEREVEAPSLEDFDRGYQAFRAMAMANECVVHYEQFLADPVATMRVLCAYLELPFDPTFVDRWQAYHSITGDRESLYRREIGPSR